MLHHPPPFLTVSSAQQWIMTRSRMYVEETGSVTVSHPTTLTPSIGQCLTGGKVNEEVLARIPVAELHRRGIVPWLNSTQPVWVLDVPKKERNARVVNYIIFPGDISEFIPRDREKS